MRNPLQGTKTSPPRLNPSPPEDAEDWPVCMIQRCGEEYPPGRHELGYRTCLKHSHRDPLNTGIPPLILQDVNKSNPSVTRQTNFLEPSYADRRVRMPLRQTRAYVQLGSYEDKPPFGREE